MRIQNNIPAINAHRQYGINNASIAKSVEKLSSGYRINRAGDDAAGLAISEKMRAQIRGLTMASKNSQDAISLVQTAEGALQESHNILQRMRELAVQSASDTNETVIDRGALNQEFQQLIKELDDTAGKTKFNDQGLIDGTFAAQLTSAAVTGGGAPTAVCRRKAPAVKTSSTSAAECIYNIHAAM
jgi:flagellin